MQNPDTGTMTQHNTVKDAKDARTQRIIAAHRDSGTRRLKEKDFPIFYKGMSVALVTPDERVEFFAISKLGRRTMRVEGKEATPFLKGTPVSVHTKEQEVGTFLVKVQRGNSLRLTGIPHDLFQRMRSSWSSKV